MLPPRPGIADGTEVVRHDYAGCAAEGALQHLEIVGNGHFWPDGHAYARPAAPRRHAEPGSSTPAGRSSTS